MPISDIAVRNVVTVTRATPIREVAQAIRHCHVGAVVVVEEENGAKTPVGVLTDRDIVVAVVAQGLDSAPLSAGDVMSPDPICITADAGVLDAVNRMRIHGVRRLPVVDQHGLLVGIVAVDDLLHLLSDELSRLARLTVWERQRELTART